MTKPLSMDMRMRLVAAISGGMTRRSAAKRFGIAASTAIKWGEQWERTSDAAPQPQGGDHRSHHLEAHWSSSIKSYLGMDHFSGGGSRE